jgi:hypothetical protein
MNAGCVDYPTGLTNFNSERPTHLYLVSLILDASYAILGCVYTEEGCPW